jgi:hypothetical protein
MSTPLVYREGQGGLVVVAVRAATLARTLAGYLRGLEPAGAAVFEAQRLRSSCERALGARGRHYDGGAR